MTPTTRRAPRLLGLLMVVTPLAAQALEPLEINDAELVELAVTGEIAPPVARESVYRVEADGKVRMVPGTGGITYNFRTGDSAVHMAGNHVEPAVSIYNPGPENDRGGRVNKALNAYAAVGNQVRVLDGDAKGATGRVIGKHGGIEHVMVDFPDEAYAGLAIGDRMQVRTKGAGMALTNAEGIKVMNASPALVEALNEAGAGINGEGHLEIGVTHRIPARVMGSGLGADQVYTGDYDIQLFDEGVIEEHGLGSLRFGDIVAIMDADHSYGRIYRSGAVSVGVVVHGRSDSAGHGPGVTTLFTSSDGSIEPHIDGDANLGKLLEIR
jgi:hypothetical protein